MAKTPVTKTYGIKHNADELALIEWLKEKTSRTVSGAYKFAAKELATGLGYVPKGKANAK